MVPGDDPDGEDVLGDALCVEEDDEEEEVAIVGGADAVVDPDAVVVEVVGAPWEDIWGGEYLLHLEQCLVVLSTRNLQMMQYYFLTLLGWGVGLYEGSIEAAITQFNTTKILFNVIHPNTSI